MAAPSRSIAELLRHGMSRLGQCSDTPRLDAELLLAHALGTGRARLLSHGEEIPEADEANAFLALLARRVAGEPLAYILGTRDFWSLTLEVSPAVLVPRPETELAVELALAAGDAIALARGDRLAVASGDALALAASDTGVQPAAHAPADRPPRVVDLGTGSGAIALAIASERPRWPVAATDRSAEALEIARRNAARLGVTNVEFLRGDWLAAVPNRTFDVIVSNPPYVAADDPALSDSALRFEPRGALTDEADGLQALLRIANSAPAYLAAQGMLILEHAPEQAAALRTALESRGYRHVRSHRDLAGRERATCAAAPHPSSE